MPARQVGERGALPGIGQPADRLVQQRLEHAGGAQRERLDLQSAPPLQEGHQVLAREPLHLLRHARQHHERRAIQLHDDAGCGAEPVGPRGGALRQQRRHQSRLARS